MVCRRFPPVWILFCLVLFLGACRSPASPTPSMGEPVQPEAAVLATEEPFLAPQDVVDSFYHWYLANRPGLNNRQLVTSRYLSERLIAEMDRLRADKDNPLNYDPYLMAQADPSGINLKTYAVEDDKARVLVEEVFGATTIHLTVDLIQVEGTWRIDKIQRGTPEEPDGVVELFYNWYLEAARAGPHPLESQAYRQSPYLSQPLIERVANSADWSRDPFVLAGKLPDGFWVYDALEEEDRATVLTELHWNRPGEPQQTERVVVFLTLDKDRWLINHISEEAPVQATPVWTGNRDTASNWERYVQQEDGFSFPYPPGWVVHDPAQYAPEDFPPGVEVQQYLLMPEDVFEEVEARRNSDDPVQLTGLERVPPYRVDILRGDRTFLEEFYVQVKYSEEVIFNGYTATMRLLVNMEKPNQFVFKHPYREGIWVVFNNLVGGDSRNEHQARELLGVFEAILDGIEFSE